MQVQKVSWKLIHLGKWGKPASHQSLCPCEGQKTALACEPGFPCIHEQYTKAYAAECLSSSPLHTHFIPYRRNRDGNQAKTSDIRILQSASTLALCDCIRGYVPKKGPLSSKVKQLFNGKLVLLV